MRKRVAVLAAFAIVGLAALGWHFWGAKKVPAEQAPLVSLTRDNFGQLRAEFNAASHDVRVVLLLSPT